MLRERPGTKTAATMAYDSGRRRRRAGWVSGSRGSAARRPGPKVERPLVAPRARKSGLGGRPPSRPHHLANKALRSLATLVAMTDGAGARIEVIVPRGHCESALADHRDGARNIEIIRVLEESAIRLGAPHAENLHSKQPHAPAQRRPFYLAVHGRPVSVRSLHPDCVVQLRGMSGSFAAWRSSGEFETFREQGAAILVADLHRSLASERAQPGEVLPSAWSDDDNVRSLAELPGRQGRGSQTTEYQAELRRQQRREAQEKRRRRRSRFRFGVSTECAIAPSRRSGRCTSRR